MTLSKLLKGQGVQAVPHDFRSSFRDWASEETNHPREVVEAALAYQVKDKVEAACARSALFERRRRLMADPPARSSLRRVRALAVAAAAWEANSIGTSRQLKTLPILGAQGRAHVR